MITPTLDHLEESLRLKDERIISLERANWRLIERIGELERALKSALCETKHADA